MFYWSKSYDENISLEEELIKCENINEIFIGTAFLSLEGITYLERLVNKHKLSKEKVNVYLSNQFSKKEPYKLLEKLQNIAKTRIFFNQTFHSKVYWVKGEKNKLIYGSSNLTNGGFKKNIEFNKITEPSAKELKDLEKFFNYCNYHSEEVNEEIIHYYKKISDELNEIYNIENHLLGKLEGFNREDDPFKPYDCDLSGMYFKYDDFEMFFKRNSKRNDKDIEYRRKIVQKKMIKIHEQVTKNLEGLNLHNHKNPENLTSLPYPCKYNKHQVSWMGIRYGKSPNEIGIIDEFRNSRDKDPVIGFQKHGCLQYSILKDGFMISLFLAVKHDAIDRNYFLEEKNNLKTKVVDEIEKLNGFNMEWIIDNYIGNKHTFSIDKEDAKKFPEFMSKNDSEGYESYLKLHYKPDSNVLKNIDSIAEEITKVFQILYPLYNLMVWRPKMR